MHRSGRAGRRQGLPGHVCLVGRVGAPQGQTVAVCDTPRARRRGGRALPPPHLDRSSPKLQARKFLALCHLLHAQAQAVPRGAATSCWHGWNTLTVDTVLHLTSTCGMPRGTLHTCLRTQRAGQPYTRHTCLEIVMEKVMATRRGPVPNPLIHELVPTGLPHLRSTRRKPTRGAHPSLRLL